MFLGLLTISRLASLGTHITYLIDKIILQIVKKISTFPHCTRDDNQEHLLFFDSFVFLALKEDAFSDVGIDNKILLRKTAKGFLRDWIVKRKIVGLIIRPDKYIFGSATNEKKKAFKWKKFF